MSEGMGNRIKTLRLSKGLTLEQVGDAVGVGKSTVRKWETGMIANMKRDKIAALANALGTTPAYLMGWNEEEKKNSPTELQLSEGDRELFEALKLIPADHRRVILDMVRSYANNLNKD